MKTLAIVQARTNSSRLPGKVLLPLDNTPMIVFQLRRILRAEKIDKVILATSDNASDDELSKQLIQKDSQSSEAC